MWLPLYATFCSLVDLNVFAFYINLLTILFMVLSDYLSKCLLYLGGYLSIYFGNFLLWVFWKYFPCLCHEVPLLFLCSWYGLSIISLRSSMFFLYVLITLHLSLVKCSNHFSVFKAWYLEHPLNYSIFQGHFYLTYWSFHFQYFKLFFFSFFEPLYWISLSCHVLNSLFPMFVLGFTLEFIFVLLGFLWKYL